MGVNGIYGLSGSGLDIESMVKVGMMSKQNEYDKMAQKYTLNEWKKANYIELNNQITTFNMSSLTDYKLTSTMKAKTATSSNEAAVTASSNANAPIMSHKVTVKELSHNAYLIGSNRISDIIANTQYYSSTHTITDTEKAEAETLASTANLKDILFKGLKYEAETSYKKDLSGGSLTQTLSLSDGGTITISTASDGTATYADTKNNINLTGGTVSNDGKTITFGSVNYLPSGTQTIINLSTNTDGKITNATATEITYSWGIIYNNTQLNSNTVETVNEVLSFDGGKQKITIDTDSSGNKKASFYDSEGLLGVHEYKGTASVDVNGNGDTITFANGTEISNLNLSARSATVTEKTSDGIVGVTMNSYNRTSDVTNNADASYTLTGNRSNLVTTYLSGKGTGSLLQSTDTAIEFTIADSTDSTNTATIKFTYGDLLGSDTTKAKTMNDLVSEINSKATSAGINVKATYDNLNGVFSIYNPKGDDESSVVIKAVGSNSAESNSSVTSYKGQATMNFLNALGLKEFDGTSLGGAKMATGASGGQFDATGANGTITVDGMEYKTQDNKVTVGGVTYTALSSTKDATGVDRPATVTVGQDVDAIIGKVKSFVESYNKILGSLYEKYDEKNDSNYKPLTQSQKDSMKEEQIEKWEEKAKKGMLYHDSTLSSIIGQMRNAITSSVEVDGQEYSVFGIGISTTGLKGQLKLDEEKLRNAINENGDAVYNVFSKLTTKTENGKEVTDYGKSGVAQRLGDIFTNATKLIKSRAGSSTDISEDSELNNLLRELQTKMSNFRKLMNAFEDKLYKKYDAMEVALSRLGTQMNFITGGQ